MKGTTTYKILSIYCSYDTNPLITDNQTCSINVHCTREQKFCVTEQNVQDWQEKKGTITE
jgi:hypothetical protein